MKKASVFLAFLMILLVCAGCSSKPVTLDVEKAGETISKEVPFTDQITHLDKAAAVKLYDLKDEDVKSVSLYVGTGATAEEISVWEGKDEAAAKTIKSAVDQRIDNQKESFVDYNPQEMPKLENPVVVTKGNYVVLCLSGDNEKAKQVIEGCFQ